MAIKTASENDSRRRVGIARYLRRWSDCSGAVHRERNNGASGDRAGGLDSDEERDDVDGKIEFISRDPNKFRMLDDFERSSNRLKEEFASRVLYTPKKKIVAKDYATKSFVKSDMTKKGDVDSVKTKEVTFAEEFNHRMDFWDVVNRARNKTQDDSILATSRVCSDRQEYQFMDFRDNQKRTLRALRTARAIWARRQLCFTSSPVHRCQLQR